MIHVEKQNSRSYFLNNAMKLAGNRSPLPHLSYGCVIRNGIYWLHSCRYENRQTRSWTVDIEHHYNWNLYYILNFPAANSWMSLNNAECRSTALCIHRQSCRSVDFDSWWTPTENSRGERLWGDRKLLSTSQRVAGMSIVTWKFHKFRSYWANSGQMVCLLY